MDGGDGCVPPSVQTVQRGSYKPLGRELYVYASARALRRPEVRVFLEFYNENANEIADQTGFIPLTAEQQRTAARKLDRLAGQGGGTRTN